MFPIFSSDSSIVASVTGLVEFAGGEIGEEAMSSPVLSIEPSILKVAFSLAVRSLVSAGADSSHGSGGW